MRAGPPSSWAASATRGCGCSPPTTPHPPPQWSARCAIGRRRGAAAPRAKRLARLRGQGGQARSKATAAEEEAGRLAEALEAARSRALRAEREYQDLQAECSGQDDDRSGLTAEQERASAALVDASAGVTGLRAAEREASGQRAALRARREALEEALTALRGGQDASAALLAEPGRVSGVLGPVAGPVAV